jgi:acyl carrier protein
VERARLLSLLDELFEESPGTLMGPEQLSDLAGWTSVTALGFMALADENFGVVPSPDSLANAKTVNDLIALCGDKVTN